MTYDLNFDGATVESAMIGGTGTVRNVALADADLPPMTDRRKFLAALATGLAGCMLPGGGPKSRGIRIAHLCDPQFGFGDPRGTEEAYRADLMRFEALIERVNDLDADLVFIAGDMTHDGAAVTRDWPRLLRKFRAPVVVTPGNHDLGNRVTRENLLRFRRVFGYDRVTFERNGWLFLSGNSQFWFETADCEDERTAYLKWAEERLDYAKSFGGRVILGSHYPPFALHVHEPDGHSNRPLATRESWFDRYLDAGARFYLAGHTHTMLARAHKGLAVLNAETTSRNFDWRPFGGRLLEIGTDFSYTWNFAGTSLT